MVLNREKLVTGYKEAVGGGLISYVLSPNVMMLQSFNITEGKKGKLRLLLASCLLF